MPEVRTVDANALKDKIGSIKLRVKNHEMMSGLVEMKAAVLREIENAPTIDAEPVRHGHWENIPGMNNTVFCSECLAAANKELAMKYKGCPFCLARMDADHIADASKKVGDVDNG